MKKMSVLFIAILFCAGALHGQETDREGADSSSEETPVEGTVVEETPVEGTVVEEIPVEGTVVEETPVEETVVTEAAQGEGFESAEEGQTISYSLRRNKYFLESLHLKNLANLAIEAGEYEQSEEYSAEAVRNAELSDLYIAEQLKRQRALKAISEARSRMAWALTAEAPKYYPNEYEKATGYFDAAITAQTAEDWDGTFENSRLVAEALAGVAAPPAKDFVIEDMPKNPAKYTVRPWDKFGDCFWNIAYWFYNDYYKWPLIYEANKEKLPDSNNPDLVEVGTIIDIPQIDNETRIGMWDSGRPYKR